MLAGCAMTTFNITPGRQLILTTPGEYSMETAVEILHWLTRRNECVIASEGWKTVGYGDLVEVGVEVQLDNIVFRVMCSYEDLFIDLESGNKDKFAALCEEIVGIEFKTT